MASFAAEFLIAELRQQGELAAAHVVQRNHAAFDSLSDADRRRVEGLAYAVAARLLDEPVSRLGRLGQHDADGPTVEAVRELFGLDDLSGCDLT
jgi:Glutamyl-tRNAGlu reductase, dimerisation domain